MRGEPNRISPVFRLCGYKNRGGKAQCAHDVRQEPGGKPSTSGSCYDLISPLSVSQDSGSSFRDDDPEEDIWENARQAARKRQ